MNVFVDFEQLKAEYKVFRNYVCAITKWERKKYEYIKRGTPDTRIW